MKRRYLLDTGIAQDFQDDRRGVRARVDRERHLGHRIGICVPVLGELWAGVEASGSRERNLRSLRHVISRLPVWPYTNDAAEEYDSGRRAGTHHQCEYHAKARIPGRDRHALVNVDEADPFENDIGRQVHRGCSPFQDAA